MSVAFKKLIYDLRVALADFLDALAIYCYEKAERKPK